MAGPMAGYLGLWRIRDEEWQRLLTIKTERADAERALRYVTNLFPEAETLVVPLLVTFGTVTQQPANT